MIAYLLLLRRCSESGDFGLCWDFLGQLVDYLALNIPCKKEEARKIANFSDCAKPNDLMCGVLEKYLEAVKYTENGVEYPIGGKFKSFAIKVCLLTSDSTVVPVVTNMRIIATPEG